MKAYNKIMSLLLAVVIGFSFTSCEEDETIPQRPDDFWGKEILEFSLPLGDVEVVKRDGANIYDIVTNMDFDLTQLKNLTPTIVISEKATISPAINEAQDFSRLVEYKVTAEDGSVKNWVILSQHSKKISDGIGSFKKAWFKDITALDIGAYENSIAVFGDKLILSRTGKIFDAKTGDKTGEIINMEGFFGNADDNKIPYVLTNDDAGNLIGCTLGAWSKPYFKVYKWDALNTPPVEMLSYKADTVETNGSGGKDIGQFGRKMNVAGDIASSAYISSYNYSTSGWGANTFHWKVSGGVVDQTPVKTTSWYNSGNIYQIACPTDPTNLANYYFSDMGTPSDSIPTTLKIRSTLNKETTLIGTTDGAAGWGAFIIDIKLFRFNTHNYLAVLHRSNTHYYISILDVQPEPVPGVADTESRVVYQASQENVNNNVNGTAGLAISKEENGKMSVYGLFSNNGIMCCDISDELE